MSRAGRIRRAARGAALVEYALIFSLVVTASVGAATFLEDETGKEADKQANCISTRPPPPSCQLAAIDPVGGGAAGNGGPNGGGGVPTSSAATVTAGAAVATPIPAPPGTKFDVAVDATLTDQGTPPNPLPDVLMTAKVTVTAATSPARVGKFFYIDCSTNASGICTFSFDTKWPEVDEISFDIVTAGVDTNYDFGDFTPIVVTRP